MARPLRIEYARALYHVTARGDRREPIYEDEEDRERFLGILGEVVARWRWLCHAYRLVVETAEETLSRGMRQLNGVYTQTYKRRHRQVGHLFQGRYKAILVDAEASLLELARCVRINPSLAQIEAAHETRVEVVVAAYQTGAYSYQQIAAHFGIHFTTVGRYVRAASHTEAPRGQKGREGRRV